MTPNQNNPEPMPRFIQPPRIPERVRPFAQTPVPEGGPYTYTGPLAMAGEHSDGFPAPRASARQVGGDHYSKMPIQPAHYIMRNGLGWAEGTAIAYISRWRDKGGLQDIEKAIHTLQMLADEVRAGHVR